MHDRRDHPGIPQTEQLGSLIYGSVDSGAKFVWNEDFHEKLSKAASELHLKEHGIVDGAGDAHKVWLPVECKGILGSDSRTYLLDLVRLTPHDPNLVARAPAAGSGAAAGVECGGVLRSELLERYVSENKLESFRVNVNIPSSAVSAVGCAASSRPWKLAGEKQEVEDDEEQVRKVGKYLVEEVIPGLVQQFRTLEVSPLDGRHLRDVMHTHGVNVRYLGAVHAAASVHQVEYVRVLCEREMLARGLKHVLRQGLSRTGPSHLAASCAHVLNCLLGRVSPPRADKQKKKRADERAGSGGGVMVGWAAAAVVDAKGPLGALCSQSLWAALCREVAARYQFELPQDRQEALARVGAMPLLRSACQAAGIQIRARQLDLCAAHPLSSNDIMGLQPVAKGSIFHCKEGQLLLSQVKSRVKGSMAAQ